MCVFGEVTLKGVSGLFSASAGLKTGRRNCNRTGDRDIRNPLLQTMQLWERWSSLQRMTGICKIMSCSRGLCAFTHPTALVIHAGIQTAMLETASRLISLVSFYCFNSFEGKESQQNLGP